MKSQSAGYRPEIDGLRAIAVLAVIFGHYGIFLFGGFIGVDVFFVISGYLITRLIVDDLDSGDFSITHFYERRVRRIIPMASVAMVAVLIAGFCIMSAKGLTEVSRFALWQSAFAGNIYEALTGKAYFSVEAITKPLLHYWSLAVEEQFYLLYPLVLWLLAKRGNICTMVTIVVIVLLSFAGSVYWMEHYHDNAQHLHKIYYLPFGRAWELALGGLLSIKPIREKLSTVRHTLKEVSGLVGVSAIAFASLSFSEKTQFPGVNALFPTMGAVFVIISGRESLVGRLLSLSVPVRVGQISYSLYLWHWPVLVFANFIRVGDMPIETKVFCILISFILSEITFHLVEQPFRKAKISRIMVFKVGLALCLPVPAMAIHCINNNGWPNQLERLNADADEGVPTIDMERVSPEDLQNILSKDDLTRLGVKGPPCFIVLGDSHTPAIKPVLHKLGLEYGIAGRVASRNGSLPVPGIVGFRTDAREYHALLEDWIYKAGIKHVLLVGRWTGAVEDRARMFVSEPGTKSEDCQTSARVLEKYLDDFVTRLQSRGIEVWIMLQVPEQVVNLREEQERGRDVVGITRAEYQQHHGKTDKMLRETGARILDPSRWLLDKNGASIAWDKDGVSVWSDQSHLTSRGGEMLRPMFEPFMKEMAKDRNR